MSNHSFTYSSITMLGTLAIVIALASTNVDKVEPSYAQPTFAPSSPGGTTDTGSPSETGAADDGENFQQFMECLFGGQASEEDISNALDGSSDSTPTEQEIRDCFTPLYETGGATGTTVTPDSGSTGETDDSSPDEDEESSTDGGTSDNDEGSDE